MDATRPGILSDGFAHTLHQVGIPGGGEADSAKSGGRSVVANAERPVGHLQPGESYVLDVANIEVIQAGDELNLLLERQMLEKSLGASFDIRWRRRGGGGLGDREKENQNKKTGTRRNLRIIANLRCDDWALYELQKNLLFYHFSGRRCYEIR